MAGVAGVAVLNFDVGRNVEPGLNPLTLAQLN